jgi:hypothetical protein
MSKLITSKNLKIKTRISAMKKLIMERKKEGKSQNIQKNINPVRTVSKGVNLKTGRGMRTAFDTWEDMEQYIDALIAEDYDNEIDYTEEELRRSSCWWNYRVLLDVDENNNPEYKIIEVYYNGKGKREGWMDRYKRSFSNVGLLR